MKSLDLQLEPISVGDCEVLQVTGDVDIATASGLRDALNLSVADHVVVDLRGVAFLDSTGLGVLVGALKRLRRRGGSLKIVTNRSDRVRRLFELTSLSGAFDPRNSVLDAIASDENWQAATGDDPAGWCHKRGLQLVCAQEEPGSVTVSGCDPRVANPDTSPAYALANPAPAERSGTVTGTTAPAGPATVSRLPSTQALTVPDRIS